MLPEPFQLVVRQIKTDRGMVTDIGAAKQLKVIDEVFSKCDSIIVATDAGREGELIFRYIYHYLGYTKPFKRLWMKQRTLYAPQIQTALDQLRINTKADRVLFLEYHNGTVSTGGLPFKFASAAFESLSDDIYPVASQYADVNLTLLPFASYIHKHSYHCGNIELLKDIDKSLMYRMMSNDVEHLAITEVRGVKEPLGILVLTYTHPIEHNCDEIRAQMDRTAIDIAVKLELKKK